MSNQDVWAERRHLSKLRGHRPLIARDNKCGEHYFQRGFWAGALAGTATARAPDAGCTLPSGGFSCLHACPLRYRLGSRQLRSI